MTRSLALGFVLVALALGGCATALGDAPDEGAAASPAASSPTALPPNAFGPETPHYFGTGGP